ncbi:MAG: hypothetical protein QOF71_1096 [Candidatus Eremiobacteraeota bacterium]|nr:hypothetical protein [Candidatus Eremiobacteraeota bacterium]
MRVRAGILALVVLTVARADAQTPPPAPGSVEAGIRITRLVTFRAPTVQSGTNGRPQPGVMECVSFVNDDARPAKRVRFVFAYDDANGKTVGGDTLDRRGTFSRGALIEGMTFNELGVIPSAGKLANCRAFSGGFDRDDNLAYPAKDGKLTGVRALRVFVEQVDYADGTAWHADPPFETLIDQRATARRGEVAARADGGLDWSAPSGGPIEITHAYFFMYGFKQMECVSFKNVAAKPVVSFQVHFAYHAVDGSVPEENTQTRSGDFAPGIENAGAVGDRSGAARFRNCWAYKAPREEPASVVITITSVTFAP